MPTGQDGSTKPPRKLNSAINAMYFESIDQIQYLEEYSESREYFNNLPALDFIKKTLNEMKKVIDAE